MSVRAAAVLLLVTIVWLIVTAPLGRALEPLQDPAMLLLSEEGRPIARRGAVKDEPVDVTKLDQTGAPSGPAVKVGALERVMVAGARPVPAPEKITQEAASALASDFSVVPRTAPAASMEALSAEAKSISLREAIQLTGGATQTTASGGATTAGAGQTLTTVVGAPNGPRLPNPPRRPQP